VELHGEHTRGQMVIEKRNFAPDNASRRHNINVVTTMDLDKVKNLLETTFQADQ
jgi:inosine-uridine nucleoside N-ribohydrolase